MGSAILNGWLKSGFKANSITIVDPLYKGKIKSYKSVEDIPVTYSADYILLAVKPQDLNQVLTALERFTQGTFISIIAGKTISSIKKSIPQSIVIRAMPNLPALIGQGITAAVASKELTPKVRSQVDKLLKPCGKLIWLNDEALLNAVTAISGSGPAYIFLFGDSLIKAAKDLGLSEEIAKSLVFETIKGSVALAEASKDSLEQLKINVTSKGGTTAAALSILENNQVLKNLLKEAVKMAEKRAQELS